MNNVYFCQFSEPCNGYIYLPYSIGFIISHLKTVKDLSENNFKILFLKEEVDFLINSLNSPKYMFFSTYGWNYNYSLMIAKTVKDKYPSCKIIFGGHHVPLNDDSYFEKYPFIDIIAHGEGEFICEDILKGKSLESINNISYNKNGATIKNKIIFHDFNINLIPSPYLSGVFDEFLYMPYKYAANLETNRTYSHSETIINRIVFFEIDRILREIKWFGKNKITLLVSKDFGIDSTDLNYANSIVNINKIYGYPKKFQAYYNKNSINNIYKINKILNNNGMYKGLTIPVQSLNDNSLKALNKSVISKDVYNRLMNAYNISNIPINTEIVLGLPLETLKTFKFGLCELLDRGQHSSIIVNNYKIYPNSKINNCEYRDRHGLKTVKIPMNIPHTNINSNKMEYDEMIISTNAMPENDFIEACMFSWVIQTFHCLGLTQYIAKYINKVFNISYHSFYSALKNIISTRDNSIINKEYHLIRKKYEDLKDGKSLYYVLPETGDFNWTLEEGSFLNFIKNKDLVYSELFSILYNMGYILYEVFEINKFLIRGFNKYVKEVSLTKSHLKLLKTLEIRHNLKNTLNIIPNYKFSSFKDYAFETIWHGRMSGRFFYGKDEVL
jgi:putative methyltransferase